MQPFVAASLLGRTAEGARFALDDGWQCRIFVLADDMARVLLVPPDGLREPRTWMVSPRGTDVRWEGRDRLDVTPFPCPAFDVDSRSDGTVLQTAALRLTVRLHPFGLDWTTSGSRFAADRGSHAYEWSPRSGVLRHYMARQTTDRYFGLGDKTGAVDKHGRRLRTLALDALGYDAETSDPLYKHWPYLVARDAGGVAYGLFYDTLSGAVFDLGCEHDNYHGFYRYCEIEDGDLDYYLFVGPRIRDVVRKFAELTGRMALGPRWSLGYANTAMSLTDAPDGQARLSEFIDNAARHDIPISSFHLGSGYSSIGRRRYVFTWNHDKFPDPEALVDKFRRSGIRLVANIKPCLLDDHPAYPEVAARGAFVGSARSGEPSMGQFWDGQGAHIDFTHREGVRWWQRSLERQLLAYDILGWNDNNEYEIWDEDAVSHGFGRPIPIARSRPLQPLLMTRATYEAQSARSPDERVFTVTRAGPPGIQRYAQTWSGDNTTSWRTLRWNIRMGLTMSLSGMFNTGHDVGGFHGPVPDPELLVRWVQNGAFSPRFIMNSWKDGGEVNTPWLHQEVIPIIRDWIRLRYRLMPYLYTLYWRAASFGEPMLRPLFYEFENEPRAFADTDDFMLGPSLLVASVAEAGQRERSVYLPSGAGEWVDFWLGTRFAGGQSIVAPAPLERIPLFVPAGAIIPTTDTADMRRLHDEPSRVLRVFPGSRRGASTFTLYEDDGLTHRHRDGERAEVECALEWNSRSIRLQVRKHGDYRLPYAALRVMTAPGERRPLQLAAKGIELVV
ncbi:MAG TPA: glycoside hydrolase family 31 protein [Casimicrobiaceae bacterium]|nr:glycoside hydrolase family 31 protein [Casimicrobiaceae bacterium]